MKIRLSAGITCLAVLVLPIRFVSESLAGEYGGSFLRLPFGVEAMGMGGAYTAMADGVSAAWWNPARLASAAGPSILAETARRSLGRSNSAVGYRRPLPGGGGMGLIWLNGSVGGIDGRDRNGDPTGTFSSSENAFAFAFGLAPGPGFRTGLALKSFYHRLASEGKATGVGIDLGFDLRLGNHVSLALAVQDIASRVNWETGDLWGEGLEGQMDKVDRYPLNYRLGLSLNPPGHRAAFALERRWVEDHDGGWHFGLSYRVDDSLVLRTGLVGKKLAAGGSLSRTIAGRRLSVGCGYFPDEFDIRGVWSIGLTLDL